jgi:hypothetical protein
MFTVMQQTEGLERFFPAHNVEYRGPLVKAGPGECVILMQDDGVQQILASGRIYVMNAEGATVGRYILPDEPSMTAQEALAALAA